MYVAGEPVATIFKKREPKLGDAPAAAAEAVPSHSLVEIFQNRNTLKRELDQAVAERDVLRGDVESLRKRHDELQRQLQSLEQMLTDPEKGQNAILYYRLRAIWDTCRQQIQSLAADLSSRQEQIERTKHAETCEQQKSAQLAEMQRLVEMVDSNRQTLEAGIGEMEQEIGRLKRFWHRGKRRTLQQEIDTAREKIPPMSARKAELMASMEQTRKTPLPAFPGLSVAAMRAINTAMLALAQYFYLHFKENNIGEMAKSAGTKPVSDVNFGMTNDCLAIGAQLRDVVLKLRNDSTRVEKLRHRSEYLRQNVTYKGEGTIPDEATLDYMLPATANSNTIDTSANALPVNVLRLNYWDVETLLLRQAEKAEAPPAVKVVGVKD